MISATACVPRDAARRNPRYHRNQRSVGAQVDVVRPDGDPERAVDGSLRGCVLTRGSTRRHDSNRVVTGRRSTTVPER